MSISNHTPHPLAVLAAAPDSNIGSVALSLSLTPESDGWCQLLPAGYFSAVDGRPHDVPGGQWFLDADGAQLLITQAQAAANDLVIDYEHQTLATDKNGQPAPAAGWFKAMEWREGSGLWIKPDWNGRARDFIQNGEYRYLSAVFPYDKRTGIPLRLHSAALVNRPGIDGMQALEALRAQLNTPSTHPQETTAMNEALRKLLAQLGIELAEGAALTDEQGQAALSALNTLTTKAATADNLATEVAALKASDGNAKPDPAKYVPIEVVTELNSQIAVLSAQHKTGELDQLITTAKDDGRLLPSMEAWARDLGQQNLAALKGFLDKAQPLAALKALQTDTTDKAGKDEDPVASLSTEEKEVARLLGKTDAEFAKAKAL
ncbi:phage protease [Pontibacterium granulatum]|uniref:phage protease n=1 Tax=Pontibacterium granulatum TaxID=2036029 RepID=UPI00249BF5B6|nr:phage protease [Pontibacterium granulatum]MDI3326773.1 phage protease [Pontibacterium granulatum]